MSYLLEALNHLRDGYAIREWDRVKLAKDILEKEYYKNIHTCSYYCTRPACIEAQRNELRDLREKLIDDNK